ncbi:MAG: zinc metalloprotease HtpX [Deltaproteobacteria bacterium]|nr:zinc metalloprotease HtpX [Deltaproteobacteria bacterium]
MNQLKTVILLGLLTGLLLAIGKIFGGDQGMAFAFIFAALMNFGAYWFSDKLVLAMYRAKEVSESASPRLYRIIQRLSQKASLPMPRVYVVPSQAPNAFATGRNPRHAAVAATEGILQLLNDEELEGVFAHELAHVQNRDILVSSIAATIAGAIMMIANMARWAAFFGMGGSRDHRGGGNNMIALLAMTILAPLAATLIQLAISRSREFGADASGARIVGNPLPLAAALEKLHFAKGRRPMEVNPATAHLFIVNPFSGKGIVRLFSTHPPVEERIRRLKTMIG